MGAQRAYTPLSLGFGLGRAMLKAFPALFALRDKLIAEGWAPPLAECIGGADIIDDTGTACEAEVEVAVAEAEAEAEAGAVEEEGAVGELWRLDPKALTNCGDRQRRYKSKHTCGLGLKRSA